MRVAIVHDYLVNRGGAERVVVAMHRIWPDAPIFTSLYFPDATYDDFRGADVRTSALQRRLSDPAAFRKLLPLYPRAFAAMDLSGFDVVVSSSSGFAHHARPKPGTCHVVYSYSPPRFLWSKTYETSGVAPAWSRALLPLVRAWLRAKDRRAAARPHFYLAVSEVARRRIRSVYGRSSTVLHPPVFTDRLAFGPRTDDFHLVVGRLLPHRNVALAVRAFNALGRRLVIVGDGPARASLEAMAGPTVEFRGVVSDDELASLYGRCRGVVVPGEEDFGLIPLEANASGRPAIALGEGGALETIVDGVTGALFSKGSPEALAAAVERAEATAFDAVALRRHAETFGEPVFAARLKDFVEHAFSSCLECAKVRRRGPGARGAASRVDERRAGEA